MTTNQFFILLACFSLSITSSCGLFESGSSSDSPDTPPPSTGDTADENTADENTADENTADENTADEELVTGAVPSSGEVSVSLGYNQVQVLAGLGIVNLSLEFDSVRDEEIYRNNLKCRVAMNGGLVTVDSTGSSEILLGSELKDIETIFFADRLEGAVADGYYTDLLLTKVVVEPSNPNIFRWKSQIQEVTGGTMEIEFKIDTEAKKVTLIGRCWGEG